MQEEVEQRIVSLMISCGKLGKQEFRKAVAIIVISDGMDYVTVIILAVVLTRRQSLLIRKVG